MQKQGAWIANFSKAPTGSANATLVALIPVVLRAAQELGRMTGLEPCVTAHAITACIGEIGC